uniref:Uncharacterized protein n=1 Tax=Equus caballus TaxID=9796 RepID=A0A9L0TIS2_HORSE
IADLRGYLLNLLLQSKSPRLKRPLQRKERRDPKKTRGKPMLTRMGITLQKMEIVQISETLLSILWDMYSEVELLDQKVILFSNF